MKLIFAGTPDFAVYILKALLATDHEIKLVLTQPDRPSGRGMTLRPSPVKTLAQREGIEVFQPLSLKDSETQERIREIQADVMIVAAYGLLLPQSVLDMPHFGCLNVHASLLPRWRGAAPIQRAILAGDSESGVCIMQMEAGLDTGPVLYSGNLPIAVDETAGTLHDKLMKLGGRLIVEALPRLPVAAVPQSEVGVTYAAKIEKHEAQLDWRMSAEQLLRQIRAFNPFPGAFASFNGTVIKVWCAKSAMVSASPGTIVTTGGQGIVVACGTGGICLTELQKAGGKRLSAVQFLAGNPVQAGAVFDLQA